jgi:hypothetical protein
LLYVAIAFQVCCAIAAGLLAWRRRDHRPFAVWSVGTTTATIARGIMATTILPVRPLSAPPFTGAARIAFHVDEALFLASAVSLSVAAIVLCVERRALAWLPTLAWVVAVAYLATHYPEIRGESLRKFYLAAELAALAASVASLATLWWRHVDWTPAHMCLFACVAVDGGTLFAGAWWWGFWSDWAANQAAFALLYAVLTGYQVIQWSRSSRL